MITKVEFNNKNGNPFYGMSNTLKIFQDASKGGSVSKATLDSAWKECSNLEQRALLMTVLFFIGDVTNRDHNIFEGKVDGGGNAQREVFRDQIIPFLVAKTEKLSIMDKHSLLNLIVEYTTFDNLVAARVKTNKGKKTVVSVINMIDVFGIETLSTYISNIIRSGTPFQKICVAKFVTRPRFSKRAGRKEMLPQTKNVMKAKELLLRAISEKANLLVEDKGTYVNFTGFYEWRKQYNQSLESVLFSTQAIRDFDKEGFIQFIDKLPSDARFRVRNRVLFSDKWGQFGEWFKEWESYKETKQAEQRKLETRIANGDTDEETVAQLKAVKKQAKVTTGAISFTQMFKDIISGNVDEIKIQPFLDKINLPYNSLVFIDDSGSMDSAWGMNSQGFTARQFASFIATIVLSKNPDADARDLVGLFSHNCRMFNGVSSLNKSPNSIIRKNVVKTAKSPLIVSEDTFLNNLRRFKSFLDAESSSNGTNVSSIPENLHSWVGGDSNRLEELQRYPVWTLISDGNFNNHYSAEASMNDFMRKCENYFGFRPFLILIDVAGETSAPITRFTGIDNIMMIPPNPANIETFLTNFKDMDTYDVYTPLLSLSRSNRYDPVKNFSQKVFN